MAEAQISEQLKAERIQPKLKAECIQALLSEAKRCRANSGGSSTRFRLVSPPRVRGPLLAVLEAELTCSPSSYH